MPFPATLDAPFVDDPGQARRLALAYLEDVRRGRSLTLPCGPEALMFEVGDIVRVALASVPWVDGIYQIETIEDPLAADAIVLTMVEADPAIWTYDPAVHDALFVDPDERPELTR